MVSGKTFRVHDCFGRMGWKWTKILRGLVPSSQRERAEIMELKSVLSNYVPSNSKDVVRWRWTKSEAFSVKSLYFFLQDSGVREDKFTRLWAVRTPPKSQNLWVVSAEG